MVAALREGAPSYSTVKKWASEFKRSREPGRRPPSPQQTIDRGLQERVHAVILNKLTTNSQTDFKYTVTCKLLTSV